jgi:hypothetical protein
MDRWLLAALIILLLVYWSLVAMFAFDCWDRNGEVVKGLSWSGFVCIRGER